MVADLPALALTSLVGLPMGELDHRALRYAAATLDGGILAGQQKTLEPPRACLSSASAMTSPSARSVPGLRPAPPTSPSDTSAPAMAGQGALAACGADG